MERAIEKPKRGASNTLERKKRAAMAYLHGTGYKGTSFEEAAQKWLANSSKDIFEIYKPIRRDGSMHVNNMVDAIFDEIDNIDLDQSPKYATAVQNAYRINRGKTSQIGDESGMYEAVETQSEFENRMDRREGAQR